ncbi:hypothetical protein QM012_001825 [Aureobasidium pullulans]|uniref:Uncharacterized protein n=1 Tax=Aureobasidium pullulans TaxID=5580 RepID=A0ABR0TD27_AURPU
MTRFLSLLTAALLSSLTIASPLSNSDRETVEVVSRAPTCVISHLDIFNEDIKYGLPFCQFFVTTPRAQSPVPGLDTQQVYDVCQCIIDGQFQPAARIGADYTPISTFKVATRTIVQYSTVTVARSTVALTTVRSVPILTTGISTVTEKHTIVSTVTAKVSNAAESTEIIAKTTVTQKVTIAKTTVTAKALESSSSSGKSVVTIAKTTITLKPTATLTIAKTTITANGQTLKPTTVVRTTTLSAIRSSQKTVTIARTTITAKASSASAKTVTSVKTVSSPQKTTTVAQTTVTVRASSTAKASSGAQAVSTRTVTSVKTVGVQTATTTTTRVVTIYASTSGTKSGSSSGSSSKKTSVASSHASAGVTASSASTTIASTCSRAPSNTPSATVTVADTEYTRFYRGCGFTEDPNNPGNAYYSENFPPVTTNLTGTLTADQAVQQCAEDAYYRYEDPNEYLSFDLHFISTSSQGLAGESNGFWQCVQYFSEQSDSDTSGYFNVTNPAVLVAYGYSSGLYSDAAAAAAKTNSKRAVVDNGRVSESSHVHPAARGQRVTYGFSNFTRAGY